MKCTVLSAHEVEGLVGEVPQDYAIQVEDIVFALEGRPADWDSNRSYTLIAQNLSEAIDLVMEIISEEAGSPIEAVSLRSIDPFEVYFGSQKRGPVQG